MGLALSGRGKNIETDGLDEEFIFYFLFFIFY
jgi:hypothetical protein